MIALESLPHLPLVQVTSPAKKVSEQSDEEQVLSAGPSLLQYSAPEGLKQAPVEFPVAQCISRVRVVGRVVDRA